MKQPTQIKGHSTRWTRTAPPPAQNGREAAYERFLRGVIVLDGSWGELARPRA